jgi:DNA-directed RNA polymerase subunit RPC12/RpoP
MANYYCKWCGQKFSSVSGLTANQCSRNPGGKRHELYEGNEKSQYTCKYCGQKFSSLSGLTANQCTKSPSKKHQPAL